MRWKQKKKRDQELTSLRKLRDGFRRIVIVNGLQPTYMNEEGVYIINLMDFFARPGEIHGGESIKSQYS